MLFYRCGYSSYSLGSASNQKTGFDYFNSEIGIRDMTGAIVRMMVSGYFFKIQRPLDLEAQGCGVTIKSTFRGSNYSKKTI